MIPSSQNKVFVIGSGGHAKVVIDVLLSENYIIEGILDDDKSKIGKKILGIEVISSTKMLNEYQNIQAVIAIGDNKIRRMISNKFKFVRWITAKHKSAYVHPSVYGTIGEGTIICAGAVVQPDTKLGSHVVINTGALVDHDCIVGSYAHLAPGVSVAGGVKVHEGSFVGIGAKVIPNKRIGEWAVVGAGATVISDVASNTTVVGTPAKLING